MVDPVTAALTGIALVTKVAEHIKEGINAYNSVADLGDQIELLFKGEKDCQRERNKKANKSDPFSTETVAHEVINHRLAQEKLHEVGVAIDMRFGPGTWAGILAERQRRIREAREAERQRLIEARRRSHELEETLKAGAVGLTLVAAVIGVLVFIFMGIK